jgi:hypothetical protein
MSILEKSFKKQTTYYEYVLLGNRNKIILKNKHERKKNFSYEF